MEIEIAGLTKSYYSEGKRIEALADVNLTMAANRIFTLLGPSGCGKTTLLRCIVGLERPDAGEIRIGGERVFSAREGIAVPPEKRGLGMVFQTYAIWPHMNVFENIAYPLRMRRIPPDEIRRRVEKTLEFVQLEGLGGRPATNLSGGQQQRVALARALVAEPKVILFDEPLSNLDAKLREETRKELRAFLTELKITAVYVTHDRVEALSLSDTIAVMKDGRIVAKGTPREIYFASDKRFVADFIGRANFFEGTVAAIAEGEVLVASAIGPIACRGRDSLKKGQAVAVCIRPEFIRLLPEGAAQGRNLFPATVESLVFVGEAYEGEARIGQELIFFRADPTADLREGGRIALQFDPDHCLVMLG